MTNSIADRGLGVNSINLKVEPVAAFENSALHSSWIQRLKPMPILRDRGDGGLQIPLKKLVLDGNPQPAKEEPDNDAWDQVQVAKQEMFSRINVRRDDDQNWISGPRLLNRHLRQRPPETRHRGFGSFRVKLSSAKFRKPPLPPSKSSSKTDSSGDILRKKEQQRLENHIWKVHALDVRLEQLHQEGTRKDLLAEFASRLDIKEKPTPVGTYHIADRKNILKGESLTPVICPKGPVMREEVAASTTASLFPGMLQELNRNEAAFRPSKFCNETQGSVRTLSTACCGSSPFSNVTPSIQKSSNSDNQTEPTIRRRIPSSLQAQRSSTGTEGESKPISLTTGKRRSEVSVNLNKEPAPDVNIAPKRSRLSLEGPAKPCAAQNLNAQPAQQVTPLSGPWLNRWTPRKPDNVQKDTFVVLQKTARKAGPPTRELDKHVDLEAPTAAAMAIVGAAMRGLHSYSLGTRNPLDAVKVLPWT